MDDDVRKLMLIAGGVGIFFFGLWTLGLVFVALMAESGGKNSDPLTATLVVLPLAEIIWCWVWLFSHAEQYSNSKKRNANVEGYKQPIRNNNMNMNINP